MRLKQKNVLLYLYDFNFMMYLFRSRVVVFSTRMPSIFYYSLFNTIVTTKINYKNRNSLFRFKIFFSFLQLFNKKYHLKPQNRYIFRISSSRSTIWCDFLGFKNFQFSCSLKNIEILQFFSKITIFLKSVKFSFNFNFLFLISRFYIKLLVSTRIMQYIQIYSNIFNYNSCLFKYIQIYSTIIHLNSNIFNYNSCEFKYIPKLDERRCRCRREKTRASQR